MILSCSEASATEVGLPASDNVIAWHKSPTTPDVTSGIASALESVLGKSKIPREDIFHLSIGTTVSLLHIVFIQLTLLIQTLSTS